MYYWGFNLTVVRFRKGRAMRKNIEKSEGRPDKKREKLGGVGDRRRR